MLRATFTVVIILSAFISQAQRLNIDSAMQVISAAKKEDEKLQNIVDLYNSEINNNPAYVVELGLALLKQSQADKNILEESSAYSFLGHGYRLLGNAPKALEYL